MKKIVIIAVLFAVATILIARNFNWSRGEKIEPASSTIIIDATAFVVELTDDARAYKMDNFTKKTVAVDKKLVKEQFEIIRRAKAISDANWDIKKINNNNDFMVVFAENAICVINYNQETNSWKLLQVSKI